MAQELIDKINKIRREKDVVILAHNYQIGEVQDIADHCGDSLELSRIAAKSDKKIILFCGVYFMAETASILCPDKKVLIPDLKAGCPMANMITAADVRELRERHPRAVIVGYVNTPAAVKAEIDICCTSTNAVGIVSRIDPHKEIVFIPDKYLADYASRKTGRRLILWDGHCPTHVKIIPEDIIRQLRLHPKAKIMVHPECRPEVVEMADRALSTSKMCAYARDSEDKEFIVGTEIGIIYRLAKDNPGKKFYPASEHGICPDMKRTNLEKVLWSLEEEKFEVRVSDDIRRRARAAINKMLEMV